MEEKIIKIMQLVQIKKDNTVEFPEEARKLIREVAEKCRKLPVYKDNTDKVDTYKDGITAGEIYLDMCLKIVNAPTQVHRMVTPKMMLPLIDDKLQEEYITEKPKLTKDEKSFLDELDPSWTYMLRNDRGQLYLARRTESRNFEYLYLDDTTSAKFAFVEPVGGCWEVADLKKLEVEESRED